MPARPPARQRLADLMESRRLELGLRWREVAEAGNISYEVIRAVRNGNGQIRPLSQHGIETGLHWSAGSVQRILDGGDPASIEPAPVTTSGGITIPSFSVVSSATADDAANVTRAVVIAAISPIAVEQVKAEVGRYPKGTPASVIFADPVEAALFERKAPELQRIHWIAALRAVDDSPPTQVRRAG